MPVVQRFLSVSKLTKRKHVSVICRLVTERRLPTVSYNYQFSFTAYKFYFLNLAYKMAERVEHFRVLGRKNTHLLSIIQNLLAL